MQLAIQQPACLGYETTNDVDARIFIGNWDSLYAIPACRKHPMHKLAMTQAHKWCYLPQECRIENTRLFDVTV